MNETKQGRAVTGMNWVRIPDGTKVKHRVDGQEGIIEGLTAIVNGSRRNPDGRTQYRVNVGTPPWKLAVEEDLLVLTDSDGLVMIGDEKVEFRRLITEQLHGAFTDDRFAKAR